MASGFRFGGAGFLGDCGCVGCEDCSVRAREAKADFWLQAGTIGVRNYRVPGTYFLNKLMHRCLFEHLVTGTACRATGLLCFVMLLYQCPYCDINTKILRNLWLNPF